MQTKIAEINSQIDVVSKSSLKTLQSSNASCLEAYEDEIHHHLDIILSLLTSTCAALDKFREFKTRFVLASDLHKTKEKDAHR